MLEVFYGLDEIVIIILKFIHRSFQEFTMILIFEESIPAV